ncbi:hypothetical protein ACIHFE_24020 [Streptomyces sp. NPDC052396]
MGAERARAAGEALHRRGVAEPTVTLTAEAGVGELGNTRVRIDGP